MDKTFDRLEQLKTIWEAVLYGANYRFGDGDVTYLFEQALTLIDRMLEGE